MESDVSTLEAPPHTEEEYCEIEVMALELANLGVREDESKWMSEDKMRDALPTQRALAELWEHIPNEYVNLVRFRGQLEELLRIVNSIIPTK